MIISHFRSALLGIAGSIVVSLASPSQAAVVTFHGILDLGDAGTTVTPESVSGAIAIAPAFVSVGDEIQINYSFNGQGLSATDISSVWVAVLTHSLLGETVSLTGTLSFLDSNGLPILSLGPRSATEGTAHVGQFFSSLSTGPLTFYALSYQGTLTAADPGDTRLYDHGFLSLRGRGLTVLTAVPEPSTWAMLVLGFAAVGWMTYRQRRRALGV